MHKNYRKNYLVLIQHFSVRKKIEREREILSIGDRRILVITISDTINNKISYPNQEINHAKLKQSQR